MISIRWNRVLLISVILVLAITYPTLWIRMLNDPVQYTGTDYVPFHVVSQISRNAGPSHIYDLGLQREYEENLGNFDIHPEDVRIFLNPPFIVPLVNLIERPDFRTSLVLWELLNLFFLLAGASLILHLIYSHFTRSTLLIFLFGIFCFFPAYKSLVIGQNSPILLFGAIMLLTGTIRKKDWMAGLGLAVMTIRPHIVIPLALPFLFNRRRIFCWFLAGAGFLGLVSLGYSGWEGITGYFEMLLVSGSGSNSTTGENNMVNVIGILLRLFPELSIDIVHWIGWGLYLLSIIAICVLWKKSTAIEGKQISIAILIITLTVPHIHMHDLILWAIPLTMLLLYSTECKEHTSLAATLPWWISFGFLLSFFSPILEASIPYIIYCMLLFAVIKPKKLRALLGSETGGT
ncbi:glycosyltransferase family 87 protein [Chloroflexota bacterium]